MYKGAARVYFIFAGKCKKLEMLYITWLNVVCVIPFNKMYEGAARVHLIFAAKCKKSEMLYIT